jgi:hypothetical protein
VKVVERLSARWTRPFVDAKVKSGRLCHLPNDSPAPTVRLRSYVPPPPRKKSRAPTPLDLLPTIPEATIRRAVLERAEAEPFSIINFAAQVENYSEMVSKRPMRWACKGGKPLLELHA